MSKYYTLLILDPETNLYCIEFGDYDRETVMDEGFDREDSDESLRWKVIRTDEEQEAIDAEVQRINYKRASYKPYKVIYNGRPVGSSGVSRDIVCYVRAACIAGAKKIAFKRLQKDHELNHPDSVIEITEKEYTEATK